MLVEAFLPGREFTLGMLGERGPRVLAPLEVVFTEPTDKHPVYAFESKFYSRGVEMQVPAQVDPGARQGTAARGARGVHRARLPRRRRASTCASTPRAGCTSSSATRCRVGAGVFGPVRDRERERDGVPQPLIGEILASALRRMRERKRLRPFES